MKTDAVRKIKAIIDEQGRTHVWVAKQLGVSREHLGAVLSGQRKAKRHFLLALIFVLGLNQSDIELDKVS